MTGGSRKGTSQAASDASASVLLPGLLPAGWHAPGPHSPGTANTSQTQQISHFGCWQSHTKPVSFDCRSAPNNHLLGVLLAALPHGWGAEHTGGAGALAWGLWQRKGDS